MTRAAAQNFYYAFLVLPHEKRNAICAVYAFMRHADDLCDSPGLTLQQRRERLAGWRRELHRVVGEGQGTDEAVLLALTDTARRFSIPIHLLDELLRGTAMDLADPAQPVPTAPAAPQLFYPTFADLYEYCYYVASVVGLICIRIFGYRDPSAEALAEHCGIALQLTNIIRDIKEDAELGRCYIPAEDMARFGRNPAELSNGADPARFRPLLEFQTRRARDFYRAGDELLPLIDDDAQPALWALLEIYRQLLEKIALRNYDVFSQRVQLSFPEKLSILVRGFYRRLV
jgi:phytoene synthase